MKQNCEKDLISFYEKNCKNCDKPPRECNFRFFIEFYRRNVYA